MFKHKHINFYHSFHTAFHGKKLNHCSNTLNDCGVEHKSELTHCGFIGQSDTLG